MSENNFERIVIEDYRSEFLYKKNKSNLNITFNRIAFIFFVFLIVCSIYSIRVVYLGGLNVSKVENITQPLKSNYRADIIDNNGSFIVKSVRTTDVGINPKLVMDKKKLLVSLQLTFPDKDFLKIKKKFTRKSFFT